MTEDEMAGWHHRLNKLAQMSLSKLWDPPGMLQSMGSQRVGQD